MRSTRTFRPVATRMGIHRAGLGRTISSWRTCRGSVTIDRRRWRCNYSTTSDRSGSGCSRRSRAEYWARATTTTFDWAMWWSVSQQPHMLQRHSPRPGIIGIHAAIFIRGSHLLHGLKAATREQRYEAVLERKQNMEASAICTERWSRRSRCALQRSELLYRAKSTLRQNFLSQPLESLQPPCRQYSGFVSWYSPYGHSGERA
jgi:hypothetical protein